MRFSLLALLVMVQVAVAQPGPDPSFADGGFAMIKLSYTSTVADVLSDSDGSTTYLIEVPYHATDPGLYIARLLADGSPDPALGPEGVVQVNLPGGTSASYGFRRMLRLRSGRTAVVGWAQGIDGGFQRRAAVLMLNSEYQPDTTFANRGLYAYPAVSGTSVVYSDAYDTTEFGENIFTSITSYGPLYSTTSIIQKLNSNGVPDSTFGFRSWLAIPSTRQPETTVLHSIEAFDDGRIIATGYRTVGVDPWSMQPASITVRLTSAGTLEPENGVVLRSTFATSRDEGHHITAFRRRGLHLGIE